jgi:hypothetical protein
MKASNIKLLIFSDNKWNLKVCHIEITKMIMIIIIISGESCEDKSNILALRKLLFLREKSWWKHFNYMTLVSIQYIMYFFGYRECFHKKTCLLYTKLQNFIYLFIYTSMGVWTQYLMLPRQVRYQLTHSASAYMCWVF